MSPVTLSPARTLEIVEGLTTALSRIDDARGALEEAAHGFIVSDVRAGFMQAPSATLRGTQEQLDKLALGSHEASAAWSELTDLMEGATRDLGDRTLTAAIAEARKGAGHLTEAIAGLERRVSQMIVNGGMVVSPAYGFQSGSTKSVVIGIAPVARQVRARLANGESPVHVRVDVWPPRAWTNHIRSEASSLVSGGQARSELLQSAHDLEVRHAAERAALFGGQEQQALGSA